MGERARYRRAVHFEYAFDRLLAAKLAQAYEILNSDRVRILGAGAQMKGVRAAAIYARVSSDRQKEEHTIASQTAALMAFAREQDCDVPVEWVFEDEGYSGASSGSSGAVARSGFARLTAEVALGHVGLVLGLEVSRLARNNADWYRLIDLCGLSDTLIGDADGVYHPALFNDRLLLGLKGTMSEAELYVLRARLNGGIRNKAARGELRRGLPVGFVWGDADGEVRFHPDEAVRTTIASVFTRFAETGSARRVWLWFRSEGLRLPLRMHQRCEIRWVERGGFENLDSRLSGFSA